MSTDADQNQFWNDAANRLQTLNQYTRGMGIDCPDILKIETTAESVHQSFKAYQGDEKEVLFFAKMEPKTFSSVFMTLQSKLKTAEAPRGHIIDTARLPRHFPTHRHESEFWESLGRAVATFGFLEEMLAKAIFAFTATRPYEESEIEEALEQWRSKLEHALTDQLGSLIKSFGKAVRDHHEEEAIPELPDLLSDLEKTAVMRNILCHGSWKLPDTQGASVPFFVNRQKEVFETAMDCAYLDKVQRDTAELACSVINTVTNMGWQFPGSTGPGKPIWDR